MNRLIEQIFINAFSKDDKKKEFEKPDFLKKVNRLYNIIVNQFRYLSLESVHEFLEKTLAFIKAKLKAEDNSKSDKRSKITKLRAIVCISAIIRLFPIDDYVKDYKKIIKKLIEYNPKITPKYMVEKATFALNRLARVSGQNRDNFFRELLNNNIDALRKGKFNEQYANAVICKELAHSYPEGFFTKGDTAYKELSEVIFKYSTNVGLVLIYTLKKLFNSKAASVGALFLENMHDYYFHDFAMKKWEKKSSEKFFSEEMILYLQLLHVLLKYHPYINSEKDQTSIFEICKKALEKQDIWQSFNALEKNKESYDRCNNELKNEKFLRLCVYFLNNDPNNSKDVVNFSIVSLAITIIVLLYKNTSFESIRTKIKNFIKEFSRYWFSSDYSAREPISIIILTHFSDNNNSQKILSLISKLSADQSADPSTQFNLIIAVLEKSKPDTILKSSLDMIRNIIITPSNVYIHKALKVIQKTYPNWSQKYVYFKDSIVQYIFLVLKNNLNFIATSLKAIKFIPNFTYNEAFELHLLVLKCKEQQNKDKKAREQIVSAIVHLFKDYPNHIPLNTILELVQFSLNDQDKDVRKKSVKAFTQITYQYLEQPNIFKKFCKFFFDEDSKIRTECFKIIQNLKIQDLSLIRKHLLSSFNLLASCFDSQFSETVSVWKVFPRLITVSKPIIHIYAESIFQIFYNMLSKRFQQSTIKEPTVLFMNSTVFSDIDKSLIKSVTQLYASSPEIVPIQPILEIFCSILESPIHPITKENILKSLKNLASIVSIPNTYPKIIQTITSIIENQESIKLVTKSMKVIGVIAVYNIDIEQPKEPLFLRSSLINKIYLKQYFLRDYFKYLNSLFDSVDIELRIKIASSISKIYDLEPESIQQYLEPFMTKFLDFIQNYSLDKIPDFLSSLKSMIGSAGRLMIPYTEKIFLALKEHWRRDKSMNYTSEVFSELVKSTHGRCEKILPHLVSESFLLINLKKDPQNGEKYTKPIFGLIQEIARFCPDYLQSIIEGINIIILNSENSSPLLQPSLKTIQYIIESTNAGPLKSRIERCLKIFEQSPQRVWKDEISILLKKLKEKKENKEKIDRKEKKKVDIEEMMFKKLKENKEKIEIKENKKVEKRTEQSEDEWFDKLKKCLIDLLTIPQFAHDVTIPQFAFNFAFFSIWIKLNPDAQKQISEKLNAHFKRNISSFNDSQFIELVEFAILAEIDLDVNMNDVISSCIKSNLYDKALFFLENLPKTCEMNEDVRNEKLVKMNIELNREDEARTLNKTNKSCSPDKVSDLMSLHEWKEALRLINKSNQEAFIQQKVECLAALDKWDEIYRLKENEKEIFSKQANDAKIRLARFMWMAEFFNEKENEALKLINLAGSYTVNDCIQKAILYIKLKMLDEANKSVHLGWRYIAKSVCSLSKSSVNKLKAHFFQAEQLRELAEVIDIINEPSIAERSYSVWQQRLQFIKDDPEKQEELFKISSLGPKSDKLTDFAYTIINNTRKTTIPKTVSTFFKESPPNLEFCKLKLATNLEERKRAENNIKRSKNCPYDVKMRLYDYLGSENEKNNIDDLKRCLKYLVIAQRNFEAISEIQIILSLIERDKNEQNAQQIALSAIESLHQVIQSGTSIQISLFRLESLSIAFPESKDIYSAINSVFQSSIPYDKISCIEGSFVLSLNNSKNKLIRKTAKNICQLLVTHYPYSIIFDLFSNAEHCHKLKLKNINVEKNEQHLKILNDLLNTLEVNHSFFYSQMIKIIKKLRAIGNNLCDKIFKKLEKLDIKLDSNSQNEVNDENYKILKQINKLTKKVYISKYDNEFLNGFKASYGQTISEILSKGKLDTSDNIKILNIWHFVKEKQGAINVIPLSSLDVELDQKDNWAIPLMGKDVATDIRVNKFFHTVQLLHNKKGNSGENSQRFSVIASNGKKYNYHLIPQNLYFKKLESRLLLNIPEKVSKNPMNRMRLSEQFMRLLQTLMPTPHNQRSLIAISRKFILIELLKGQIQMHDLISLYLMSKGRQSDIEPPNKSRNSYVPHQNSGTSLGGKESNTDNIKDKIKNANQDDLRKAILVTSKDAWAYIKKTAMFARTMGMFCALSYIIGGVDNSPRGILIDKTTGEVTYTSFIVVAHEQPDPQMNLQCATQDIPHGHGQILPFRLTKMVVGAFGPYGTHGPFKISFEKTFRAIIKFKNSLALCSQLVIGEPPFEEMKFPHNYLAKFQNEKQIKEDEIDKFYSRFDKTSNEIDKEIDKLIEKATNIENVSHDHFENYYPWL